MIGEILRSRILPWILLFLALAAANVQIGGTNAVARISGLRAITEGGTLHTDLYHDWSDDWSLSPNGHYYPNKAPGGVLFGLPAFALIDIPYRWLSHGAPDNLGRAPPPDLTELLLFNLVMQLLPFAALVLAISRRFGSLFESGWSIHFFALAALFGNTAALYLGCYFGHGLSALFTLAGFAAWLRGRYGAASALMAASLLTDYGTACLLPFFLSATLLRERSFRPLREIALAAVPFALVWIWYHWTAFGSPFALAIKYSNPDQIETVAVDGIWGMYGLFPSPSVLGKLLFGAERGILYTQPWVLAIFPLLFTPIRLPRGTKLFLGGGLCGLLWMNASVAGWHGGLVLGPRYLSLIFPSLALCLALSWRDLPRPWHLLLWLGLLVSLAFRVLVYPFSILAPVENLWSYHLFLYSRKELGPDPYPDLLIALLGFILAGSWVWWRETRESTEVY